MIKQRNQLVAILDIGSFKIVCFIAKISLQGKVEIVGIGHQVASGIKSGIIVDLKSTEYSIIQAVESAEKMAGERVQKLYLAVSPNNLLSQRMSCELNITGHEINSKDLNKLTLQALDKYRTQPIDVIHTFSYDYILDGNRGITNPLGMYGDKLSADFHIISTPSNIALNMANCLHKCQLELESYIAASYASGLACLTEDEMKLGTILIEFGGGTTSISVFQNNSLIFTDGIPIGGINVTSDIAKGLSIDLLNAERLKILYGSVIMTGSDTNTLIQTSVDDDTELSSIKKELLVEIVRSRVEEIIELIMLKLNNGPFKNATGSKIVLTGGGAQLSGIKELINHMFGAKVRIGYPRNITGLAESTSGTAFSTSIGMLIYIINQLDFSLNNLGDTSSLGSKVLNWFKEVF